MSNPDPAGTLHGQTLLGIEAGAVRLAEVRHDRPGEVVLLTVGRRGEVLSRAVGARSDLEPGGQGAPQAPAGAASGRGEVGSEAPCPGTPRVELQRSGARWEARLNEGSTSTLLATLPRASAVTPGPVRYGPCGTPQLAALPWASREDDLVIRGVAVLDLTRGRARLAEERGVEALAAGRPADARGHLAEAVKRDPLYANAHYNLACALARSGETEPALAALARALELEPVRLRVAAAIDGDLDALRDLPAFAALVGPGRTRPE